MLRLSPLLVIYLALIVINPRSDFFGDEGGYVRHAINLTHGYYTPTTDIDLWWGPGYPIILAPFALLKIPWAIAKLLNAFFLFFAVYYFHQTLRLYTNSKYVLHLSYLFGLYLPFLRFISYLLTETFVASESATWVESAVPVPRVEFAVETRSNSTTTLASGELVSKDSTVPPTLKASAKWKSSSCVGPDVTGSAKSKCQSSFVPLTASRS